MKNWRFQNATNWFLAACICCPCMTASRNCWALAQSAPADSQSLVQAEDPSPDQLDAAPPTQTDPPTEQAAAPAEQTQAPAGASAGNESGQAALSSDSLGELEKQWAELNQKLNDKRLEFDANKEPQQQTRLRQEYLALDGQATELLDRLRVAALAAVEADASDSAALRTLMGVLANDAQFGRSDEVLRIGDILVSKNINPKYFEVASGLDRLKLSAKDTFQELVIRQREASADDLPRIKLTTSKGDIVIELFENQAPNTTANFINLVESKFYDGVVFHRVIEDFMAQTGDPTGTGNGGPGYSIPCECYTPEMRRHYAGSVSMAHSGRDTGGSQFFLVFTRSEAAKNLDGKHTVFGRIIAGQDVLNTLNRTHQIEQNQESKIDGVEPDNIVSAEVIRKRDHEYPVEKQADDSAKTGSDEPPGGQGADDQGSGSGQPNSGPPNRSDNSGG